MSVEEPENEEDKRTADYKLLRKIIGENVILTEEERKQMLADYFSGEMGIEVKERRKDSKLRHVIGDERILEPEERLTIVQFLKGAVQKFFKAGVREGGTTQVEKLGLSRAAKTSFLQRIGRR